MGFLITCFETWLLLACCAVLIANRLPARSRSALQGWHIHTPALRALEEDIPHWWMVQWSLGEKFLFNVGPHLDLSVAEHPRGFRYGPYLDVHLPCLILSVGRNPAYSCELDRVINASRGGLE